MDGGNGRRGRGIGGCAGGRIRRILGGTINGRSRGEGGGGSSRGGERRKGL